ncbi:hypothetical protein A1QO_02755 [Vibrio genomosp. F10 str. ZF-129]|uniref:ArnR1-like winged helix-turn-helix domain-containing protein n=2 Tax=Vibrio genomosp. F10 TaxID=723171 RepID=A0A1E5BKD8_9VIBR|nr:hypothetical protein A1QO_02755 [Vibrio genomosp. F10 str. ZF-129]
MLTIHYIELVHGLHTAVNTSYLRKKVKISLCKELASNHFLVSLRALATNGYLVYQPNENKLINAHAKVNESMWQLTNKGRLYAEELHSTRMRPKRTYTKKKPKK